MTAIDWNEKSLVITCGGGLEEFLSSEIQQITGSACESVQGGVTCEASLENIYKICMWSRIASRVLLPVVEFPYKNEQDLYDRLRQVHWQEHFTHTNTLAISTSSDASVQANTQFLTYRTKDAVVDYFKHFQGARPNIDTRNPDVRIHLHLGKQLVSVSLDLSGEPLHKRGYRVAQNEAPMKETLAASLLMSVGWPGNHKQLVDPMCGSGTLLIEAAMMQANMAPGLIRKRFGFEKWALHSDAAWNQIVDDAIKADQSETFDFSIKGFDSDGDSIQAALKNIEAAGLEGSIHVERRELSKFALHEAASKAGGVLVCNPPYGERLDKNSQLMYLYRAMGRILQTYCMGWKSAIITNQVEFADALQLDNPLTYKVFNGPIRCVLRCGDVVQRQPQFSVRTLALRDTDVSQLAAPDLANRLKKNLKGLSKWLRNEAVYAYRIYDADIPEYNMALDWYNGHLHVQEYAPPKTVDAEKAKQRLDDALSTISSLFDVSQSHIHVKSRSRQKGKQQYQKLNELKRTYLIDEYGALLLVNLDDYLDTGLFLDHRPTRYRIQQLAQGKRFLNLYCYTGAASVHAALGGAKRTVSVDMSATYLNWARNNLYINGCAEATNELIRSDCMAWLKVTRQQFDVIFVDPPTFSNSKKMQGHFDVQAAHVELIDLAMKRLEPGGVLIFSNNYNRFKLDDELLERYEVNDITKQSLPQDFSRGKPSHRCWEFRLKPSEGKKNGGIWE